MCCQLNGYNSAAAPCTAALAVSLSWATIRMRRSSSSASMRDTMARAGRCQSRRARGSPAFARPLPSAGGTSSSTNSGVLRDPGTPYFQPSATRTHAALQHQLQAGETISHAVESHLACLSDLGLANFSSLKLQQPAECGRYACCQLNCALAGAPTSSEAAAAGSLIRSAAAG